MRTRQGFHSFWLIVFVLLIAQASPALGAPITFEFSGDIVTVNDPTGALEGSVSVGDPFTGEYTFEGSAVDQNPLATIGDYLSFSPYGIRVFIGSLTFESNPNMVNLLIEILNNHSTPASDNYLVRSSNNRVLPTCPCLEADNIEWQLDDSTANALSSDAMLLTPPDLTAFSQLGLTIDGFSLDADQFACRGNQYTIRGMVRTIAVRSSVSACNPCAQWNNHGEYVRCVVADVNNRLPNDPTAANHIIDAAARSDIGKQGVVPPQCQ